MLKSLTIASLLLAVASIEIGWSPTASTAQPILTKPQSPSKSRPAPESKPNGIFKEMIPLLLRKTHVPLRLPEYIPYSSDKETPLYAILEVAEPDAYSIQLAWIKGCEGGNACHVGYIGGSRTRTQPRDKPEVPVTLTSGIKGSFVNFDCGAHCDDASLYWNEGEFYYEISLKASDDETLIRMANSAIRVPAK